MKVVERSKIWFSISLAIICVGLVFMFTKGLNFGIDFKGGTVVQIDMDKTVEPEDMKQVEDIISQYMNLSDTQTRVIDDTNIEITIKSDTLEDDKVGELHREIKDELSLKDNYLVKEDKKGSTIGEELTQKAWIAVIIAMLAMLVYIGFRFEFKFGAAAIVALIHDILITLSIFAIFDIRINSPFIAGMLTILGYSINDTIVLFDRIRENKKKYHKKDIDKLVDDSISETLTRTINTSVSTLLTISALFIMVPAIREFTFPLIVGVISGTYSSIFIASPIWVILNKKMKNKKGNKLKTA